jgi:flagellar biosynthesis GTPase FlhF
MNTTVASKRRDMSTPNTSGCPQPARSSLLSFFPRANQQAGGRSAGASEHRPTKKPRPAPAGPSAQNQPGEALVGQAIEVLWPQQGEWFSGVVDSYKDGVHVIAYADGSSLGHDLAKSRFRVPAAPLASPAPAEARGQVEATPPAVVVIKPTAVVAECPRAAAVGHDTEEQKPKAPPAASASKPTTSAAPRLAPIFAAKGPRKKTELEPASTAGSTGRSFAAIFAKAKTKKPASKKTEGQATVKTSASTAPTPTPTPIHIPTPAATPAATPTPTSTEEKATATVTAAAEAAETPAANAAAAAAAETAAAGQTAGPETDLGAIHPMFLTKEQKLLKARKESEARQAQAQEESLRQLREQQERNRRDDAQLSKGKEVNPFFQQCKEDIALSARAGATSTSSQHAAKFCASWTMIDPWLVAGGVVHVSQRTPAPGCPEPVPSPLLKRPLHVPAPIRAPANRQIKLVNLGKGKVPSSDPGAQPVRQPPSMQCPALDADTIEQFARSESVIQLLCGVKSSYETLPRVAKVAVNMFQRCLRYRFGDLRRVSRGASGTASGGGAAAADLWCQIYSPRCTQDVCGNRQSVTRLTTWLNARKSKTIARNSRAKQRNRYDQSESDSDDDFVDSNPEVERSQTQMWAAAGDFSMLLLSGPTGAGKTAAIHAVAAECGYSNIEINSSQKRNSRAILGACGEATQSHGLKKWQTSSEQAPKAQAATGKAKKQKTAAKGRKGKGPSKLKLGVKVARKSSLAAAQSEPSADLSLIVFEEVDALFEDDRGFFSALSTLAASTKRPIILTSNCRNLDYGSSQLDMLRCDFGSPSADEICTLLRCICLTEVTISGV